MSTEFSDVPLEDVIPEILAPKPYTGFGSDPVDSNKCGTERCCCCIIL